MAEGRRGGKGKVRSIGDFPFFMNDRADCERRERSKIYK